MATQVAKRHQFERGVNNNNGFNAARSERPILPANVFFFLARYENDPTTFKLDPFA